MRKVWMVLVAGGLAAATNAWAGQVFNDPPPAQVIASPRAEIVNQAKWTLTPLSDNEPVSAGGAWYMDKKPDKVTITPASQQIITYLQDTNAVPVEGYPVPFIASTNIVNTVTTNRTKDALSCPAAYVDFPVFKYLQTTIGGILVVPVQDPGRTRPGLSIGYTMAQGNLGPVNMSAIKASVFVLMQDYPAWGFTFGVEF